jgi:hypothetical protein
MIKKKCYKKIVDNEGNIYFCEVIIKFCGFKVFHSEYISNCKSDIKDEIFEKDIKIGFKK